MREGPKILNFRQAYCIYCLATDVIQMNPQRQTETHCNNTRRQREVIRTQPQFANSTFFCTKH
jgi:hypothetical protein